MFYTEDAVFEAQNIAREADRIMSERHDSAFEILADTATWDYVIAAPRNGNEAGDPNQPTAVTISDIAVIEDAEELYREALKSTDECLRRYETEEEW